MIVLGIDQSYTGFGISFQGDVNQTYKVGFGMKKYKDQGERLSVIAHWLHSLINDFELDCDEIDLAVMEGYANGVKFGREMSGELGGQIKRVMHEEHLPLLVVPPTSLKKFVCGTGNAKKNEMLLHVYKRWDAQFSDDNMADAYSLAKFGLAYSGEEIGATKTMLDVIEKYKKDQAK